MNGDTHAPQLLVVHVPTFDVAGVEPRDVVAVAMKHKSAAVGLMTALDIADAYGLPGRTGIRLQDHDGRLRYRTVDERHVLPTEAVVAREPVGHHEETPVPDLS